MIGWLPMLRKQLARAQRETGDPVASDEFPQRDGRPCYRNTTERPVVDLPGVALAGGI